MGVTVAAAPILAEEDRRGILVDSGKRKKTFSSPFIHRLQRRHFVLFDILPSLGAVGALAFLGHYPVGLPEGMALFVMWLLTGIGITVGYHRLFTHRSFKATPFTRATLAILAGMAGQGGIVSWTALHRRHHEYSDLPGDPHSPNLSGSGWWARARGLVHAHYTWMIQHDYPSIVHDAPDLLRDKTVMRIDRLYHLWGRSASAP